MKSFITSGLDVLNWIMLYQSIERCGPNDLYHDKIRKTTYKCAHRKDSNQPGIMPNLIGVFAEDSVVNLRTKVFFMRRSSSEVIKLFPCSTQLSTIFQLLIKTKNTDKEVSCFKSLRCCIYLLINVKMPTIVGILTFMSRINFLLSYVEHEKSFITSCQTKLI